MTVPAQPTAVQTTADVVRAAYGAFAAGDVAALSEVFAPDVVFQIGSTGILDGTYLGQEAVFGMLGSLVAETGGTLSMTVQTLMTEGPYACALVHETAERAGRSLDCVFVHVLEVADGRIRSLRASSSDPATVAFWQ